MKLIITHLELPHISAWAQCECQVGWKCVCLILHTIAQFGLFSQFSVEYVIWMQLL